MMAVEARQLVERAATGDQQAFSELVMGCQRTLYTAAMAITHNEQDTLDVVQEAVLKGWAKLGTLKEQAYFTTWLTRIVVHTAINFMKRRKHSAPLLVEIPAKGSPMETRMDIRRAIDSLDDKTRLCTVLYYFEDMSIDQIAQVVGIRAGTVKSRLFRAREKLRLELEGYDHDE